MKKKLIAALSGVALVASLTVVASSSSNAALRLPRTAMPACAAAPTAIYCIQSVSVSISGAAPISLTYVRSGSAVPQEVIPKNFWAPIATIRNGKVEGNDWWLPQDQREMWTSEKLQFIDLSPLLKTAEHPEYGAKFDPATNKWDITRPIEWYSQPTECWNKASNTPAKTTLGDCFKGSIGVAVDNELRMIWQMYTAEDAVNQIKYHTSVTRVDLTQLSELQQRPVRGSTYDAATKTFSQTEPYIIPVWVGEEALRNGWAIAGVTPTVPNTTAITAGDTSTATTATPTAPDTATVVAPIAEVGRATPGRWTHPRWESLNLGTNGYDGLYIETKAFNEFTNHFFVDVLPTLSDATNKTNIAGQVGNKGYAISLDPDLVVTVKIRAGSPQNKTNVVPAVTVAVGVDVDIKYTQEEAGYSFMTITGQPVTVPLAKQAQDCLGEEGVAKAMVRQLQTLVVINDENSGFGIDGVSGNIYVGSNGVCSLSTPTWKEESKSFEWNAAAPHFAPDGVTVNKGFYKAVIPTKDAEILWGLTNPRDAATALQVSVTTEAGGSAGALSAISVKGGKIIIDVSGFEYSRPKLTIKMKPNYKPKTAATSKKSSAKKTITCVMGKTTKKVTGTAPKCPAGYKQSN